MKGSVKFKDAAWIAFFVSLLIASIVCLISLAYKLAIALAG